jgi:hypothetical protein
MSNSVILNSSLVLRLEDLGKLKAQGQRLAVDLHRSDRVDKNALERAMIAFQRAVGQLEGVIMGTPHQDAAKYASDHPAFVELVPGEAVLVGNPLSEAIESTARVLEHAQDEAKSSLLGHLDLLLVEQRSQLFTSPSPVREQIGVV